MFCFELESGGGFRESSGFVVVITAGDVENVHVFYFFRIRFCREFKETFANY